MDTDHVTGYDELALLRRSTFAATYLARADSGEKVALKVRAGDSGKGSVRKSLNRHWLAAQQLSDLPNVLTVLDSGFTDAGRPYVATDFCEGGSLSDRVKLGAALPAEDVLNAAVQVALALHQSHRVGLCHRGIKPNNVLLTAGGQAMLADFVTAAMRADHETATDESDGAYLAPEITGGQATVAFGEVYFQTGFDPTPAPEGRHLMSVFGQYASYTLAEGDWDSQRDRIGGQFIDLVARFAPDIGDCILHHEVLGPPDIARRVGLTGGHIFQGEVTPDQMWLNRLTPRTPIPGFYLCGAATDPAGLVIGLNGRNAAMALLADGRRGI